MSSVSYFRSLGYGYHQIPNSPDPAGSVLWWRISVVGRLRILREYAFSESHESEIAAAVKETDRKLGIRSVSYTVAHPNLFPKKVSAYPGFQGETVSERLAFFGMPLMPGDDDVVNGWPRVLAMFRADGDGVPWLTIDPACKHLITALTTGMSDETKPEELTTEAPPLLALRLGAMTRPSPDVVSSRPIIPVGSPAWFMQQERQKTGGRKVGSVQ